MSAFRRIPDTEREHLLALATALSDTHQAPFMGETSSGLARTQAAGLVERDDSSAISRSGVALRERSHSKVSLHDVPGEESFGNEVAEASFDEETGQLYPDEPMEASFDEVTGVLSFDDTTDPPASNTPHEIVASASSLERRSTNSASHHYEDKLSVPEYIWLEAGAAEREPCVVEVRGNSMIDEGLADGCCVAFYADRFPRSGELVVADVEGEGRVCRRYKRAKGRIELHSANAAEVERYPTLYFTSETDLAIYGIVRAYRDVLGEWHAVQNKGGDPA